MLPRIAAAFPLREQVYCWCYSFLFGAAVQEKTCLFRFCPSFQKRTQVSRSGVMERRKNINRRSSGIQRRLPGKSSWFGASCLHVFAGLRFAANPCVLSAASFWKEPIHFGVALSWRRIRVIQLS